MEVKNHSSSTLFKWSDCLEFDIIKIHDLYKKYVNQGQVSLISSFEFGRVVTSRSEGVYIYIKDDRKILDFTGGIGVLHIGHNHPRILAARIEFQKQKRPEVHKNFFSPYVAGLSHNIAELLPEDLNISYFCNSGAESVEGAVKLAYKYHNGKRKHILSADISFHGKLLGSGGLTGSKELTFSFPTIPNIKRFKYNDISSLREQVSILKNEKGESDIYAIVIEPFSSSAVRYCSKEFLFELRQICTAENIVLIFDEVYSGWGKTGQLFSFMHYNVVPDIVTYSKTFGGGKSSISGYTSRTPYFKKAYGNLQSAILHSTTYNAFGEECITALEAINIIIEEDLVLRAREIEKRLETGLNDLKNKYPDIIIDVRGMGAHFGILIDASFNALIRKALSVFPSEFINDERFLRKLTISSIISELFTKHNILTYYGDNRETMLLISPMLITKDDQLDYFLNALDQTLKKGKYKLITKFAKQKIFKS